ncbi:MAG: BON domain-containing protein [Planctomycetota bacterium]|nr:BON domain-containing protein [Planctomycetota bacterium]MDA1213581.1 BON domain-containing protein [Planctomycetota bacterium]
MSRRTSELNAPLRFAPTMRRISYQFDDPMRETTDVPPTHTVAFEKQNDRDLQAECDTLIEQAIRDAWRNAGFGHFRHLRVEVQSGDVKLYGRLNSFYYKQMAYSLIRNVHGVRSIENEIQVDK